MSERQASTVFWGTPLVSDISFFVSMFSHPFNFPVPCKHLLVLTENSQAHSIDSDPQTEFVLGPDFWHQISHPDVQFVYICNVFSSRYLRSFSSFDLTNLLPHPHIHNHTCGWSCWCRFRGWSCYFASGLSEDLPCTWCQSCSHEYLAEEIQICCPSGPTVGLGRRFEDEETAKF